jgi:HlyD family secretion protein
MKKIFLIFGIIALVIAVAFFVVKKRKAKTKNFKLVSVQRGDVTEKAIAIGQIVPRQDISIKTKIRGILKKKYVEVGDLVDIGTSLMEVNPDPTPVEYMQAKRKVEIAKVAMDNAETECKRSSQLRKQKWVSQQEYDDCKQAFDEAELRYEMARENFDLISTGTVKVEGSKVDNIIRSPIKGTILELLVDVGDPVVPLTTYQAGTPLMTVADMTDLIFKGTVDEIDVGKIEEKVPAIITAGALPDKKLFGAISEISPKAKREANATLFGIEIEFSSSNSSMSMNS